MAISIAGLVGSVALARGSSDSTQPDGLSVREYLSLGGLGASALMMWGGIHVMLTQPIDEEEAKYLGQEYNDNLRRKYGLPVAATPRTLRPNLRFTAVSPYVAESQAGLAVRMSF